LGHSVVQELRLDAQRFRRQFEMTSSMNCCLASVLALLERKKNGGAKKKKRKKNRDKKR